MNASAHPILFLMGWTLVGTLALIIYATQQQRFENWTLTVKLLVSLLVWPLMSQLKQLVGSGAGFGESAAYLPLYAGIGGFYLAILWVPELTKVFAAPFGSLFDGGGPQEEKPFYSIAWAKRKQSQPHAAILEIKKQLEKFPDNHEGMMLMAEILADDLQDASGAEAIIKGIVMNPKVTGAQASSALHYLADCRLRHSQDSEGAVDALRMVVKKFPGTAYATTAEQRISRVPTREAMLENMDRTPVEIGNYAKNLGLKKLQVVEVTPEQDAENIATAYRAQLEKFPMDAETRVNLAFLYAKEMNKISEAISQLLFLTENPIYTPRQKAQWLNSMADIHLQFGQDRKSAAKVLQR
ncbi:MAG: hypothetical protein JWN25_900, partial [Verrucomicrobiales bacterium]|nr:hypothetical protein [Verrucomicrobiales bacterium]